MKRRGGMKQKATLSTLLSDTVQSLPPAPAPNNQSKGSSSASASGKGSAGRCSEIPAKARPVAAPGPARTEPPPQPHLIMKPRRSDLSSMDPNTLRVVHGRDVCLEAFKLRAKHKVAKSVWAVAVDPSELAIAWLHG